MSNSSPLRLLALGFVLGLIVAGACWLMTRQPAIPHVNKVTVDYVYESDPGSASGYNGMQVDSLQFFPGYVVITDTQGKSTLLAADRLRSFSFRSTGTP